MKATYYGRSGSFLLCCAVLLAACFATPAIAAVHPAPGQPQRCELGDKAELFVPAGYTFLDKDESVEFMKMTQNIPTNRELGTIIHDDSGWFIVFEFDGIGYVKDDEQNLDASALLKSIKRGNEEGNKQRAQMGVAPLNIVGWHTKPQYNAQTNNLEWCVEAESEGEPVLNYNTRILGRKGVMEVTLVCGPEQLDTAAEAQRQLLGGFAYLPGQKYAEWQKGDKIAEYGLGALIVGGGAAVAYKTGLLGKLIKPLLIGGAVVLGAIGKFWKKLLGRE